jgi:peptidyl-prolyl cis-trans isomerase A (cyclophilin A)
MTDRAITCVEIETVLGVISVELFPQAAPITVANFLHYVESGAYDGGAFHRSVTLINQPNDAIKIEVIQGGLEPERTNDHTCSIPLERTTLTGVRHVDGAISMGRTTPDSADSEFFICIGDQPELDYAGHRNPDGQGFAAFGKVLSGMEVARKIQQSPVEEQRLMPPVPIISIRKVD